MAAFVVPGFASAGDDTFACDAYPNGTAHYYAGTTHCYPVDGSPPAMSSISDEPSLYKYDPSSMDYNLVASTFSMCWFCWLDSAAASNTFGSGDYIVADNYAVVAPPGYSGSESGLVSLVLYVSYARLEGISYAHVLEDRSEAPSGRVGSSIGRTCLVVCWPAGHLA
jgi:hypothetical protein